MNLGELRTAVRDILNRHETDLTDSMANRYINWAEKRIAQLHTFDELHGRWQAALVKGQQTYNFPERTKEVFSLLLISNAESRKLVRVSPREFDRTVPYPEYKTESRPEYYVHYGKNFELYPIPDSSYTLECRNSWLPSGMTEDAHTPDLEDKDDLIVALAVSHGWMELHELEDASIWEKHAVRLFQEAVESEEREPDLEVKAEGFGIVSRDKRTSLSPTEDSPFS